MKRLAFVGRGVAIVFVALVALVYYGAARMQILDDAEAIDRLRGRALRVALTWLGATFIKLGQVMSTRPDLFAPGVIAELRLLQDELPPFPGEAARASIRATLGRPLEEVFEELDDAPVAAASVAQVHRGRLKDGTEVAVKVLRPDVREKTERDGTILVGAARALEWASEVLRHADLVGHVEHFVAGVLAQTDLRTEAENYTRFEANFADVAHIRFPRVYPELSGEEVMTMTFVRGRKLDTLEPSPETDRIATRLRRAFLKMLFDDGFLHADLHPGNLLVADDGTITIFDVGLAKQLTEELLDYYIDFNKCLVLGTAPDFVQHLKTYHAYVDGRVDWDELSIDVEAMVAAFRGKPARELEFGAMIERAFGVGRKYGVRPLPDLTLIMVGLVTAEGMGKRLAPDSDSFGEVASYLLPILARRNQLPSAMELARLQL